MKGSPLKGFEEDMEECLEIGDWHAWRDGSEASLWRLEENDPLTQILKRMSIPVSRLFDVPWLRAHLAPDYLDHPDMPEALRLLREQMGEEEWNSYRNGKAPERDDEPVKVNLLVTP